MGAGEEYSLVFALSNRVVGLGGNSVVRQAGGNPGT